ncbi:MAG TPA: hypothetical protein VMG41_17755 [Gemmatimonadales bacterium]|nr:hypothetical protein [Gemmatimonadales bacterium]
MLSPSGWGEVPCARCGARIQGLGWGELCPACRHDRDRRANRLASRISLLATLLVGLYAMWRLPPLPLARIYGVIAVLVTYIVVRKVVHRVAIELLPR